MPFSARAVVCYHLLRQNHIPVMGFLDNNPEIRGKVYDGCEIFAPQDKQSELGRGTVAVCTFRFEDEIVRQLRGLGAHTVLKMQELSVGSSVAGLTKNIRLDAFAEVAPAGASLMREIIYTCGNMVHWREILKFFADFDGVPYIFEDQPVKPKLDQPYKVMLCVNATFRPNEAYFDVCLESIKTQANIALDVFFFVCKETRDAIERLLKAMSLPMKTQMAETEGPAEDAFALLEKVRPHAGGYDYIVVMNAHDVLAANAIRDLIEAAAGHRECPLVTAFEDRLYKDSCIAPYYKSDYLQDEYVTLGKLLRNFFAVRADALHQLRDLKKSDVWIVEKVLYHFRVDESVRQDNGIKPVAFYLPQFHPIPENDQWWGKGFTEWVNVRRGYPMFPGHYQPHEPGELGYYDLVADPVVQRRQAVLARKYGIYGFCYYYYWFNGRRLLEKPLDRVLQDKSLDLPFCICWANESWSRRWDGSEHEVLIRQVHNRETDIKFIYDVIPILKDPRYIRINGAPLLLIYRADLFENFPETVRVWREICAENGLPQIHVSMVQSFRAHNPEMRGCDSATEFPPHMGNFRNLTEETEGIDPEFKGRVHDYREYAARAMNRRKPGFLNFRGAMPSWDNTARRLKNATIFKNADPEEYKKLLISLTDYTSRMPREERFIFINAWNEWAEGTHLEPDKKYGDAYLQATYDAIRINC